MLNPYLYSQSVTQRINYKPAVLKNQEGIQKPVE